MIDDACVKLNSVNIDIFASAKFIKSFFTSLEKHSVQASSFSPSSLPCDKSEE